MREIRQTVQDGLNEGSGDGGGGGGGDGLTSDITPLVSLSRPLCPLARISTAVEGRGANDRRTLLIAHEHALKRLLEKAVDKQ